MVDRGMILPVNAAHLEVRSDQKFIMAVPVDDRMPDFPANANRDSAKICLEFVVTEDGEVHSPLQIDSAAGCEPIGDPGSMPFVKEAVRAVEDWTFFGAAICDFNYDEAECDTHAARLRPVSIKLAYKFTFSTAGGKRVVAADAAQ